MPRARIPCSIFFWKFFAKAGTLSIRYGLNSFILIGIFFKVSIPVRPTCTVATEAPFDMKM